MIYMWTAAQIHNAVTTESPLNTVVHEPGEFTDPTATIQTPNNLGGNDVERDAAGNVYFSLNLGTTYIGEIVRVDNNGSPPWPGTTTTVARALNLYDWARSLAFDGLGDLSTPGKQEASNRLYLDMDQGSQGVTTPTVVGISAAGDADGDGVPDALDNCRQTWNADQTDSDTDGCGDVCEGDLNGDGKVDSSDLPLFVQDFGSTGCSSNGDLDSDGDVDGSDLGQFVANLNSCWFPWPCCCSRLLLKEKMMPRSLLSLSLTKS